MPDATKILVIEDDWPSLANIQLLLELAAHQALDVADEKAKGVRLFVHDVQPI